MGSIGLSNIAIFIQVFLGVIIGLFFWNMLKTQQGNKTAVNKESHKELENLRRMRSISLTEPLSEKIRPSKMEDIVGQKDGLKALRAALCGPNPQHVIIYGPPGIGKTAAARLVLEEARKNPQSPFKENASFIEVDATIARFDERGIADPLIGSVHDPIYQGAGPLGIAGIPQPKAGAVTKAHGGMLFIDEIGELHPIQMNKLLKVLEDRKVHLESTYYCSEDTNIPSHIHDIFQNGLPADFRLVGATTRLPENIPPAIRSRCVEIYFRELPPGEISLIAARAARSTGLSLAKEGLKVIEKYSPNGREAVNIIQIAAGIAITEGRKQIRTQDIEWVINNGQYSPRPDKKIGPSPQVGVVNGLAVHGPGQGSLLEIEASAIPVKPGQGKVTVTGVIDEEQIGEHGHSFRRRSMALAAVDNVLTVMQNVTGVNPYDYNLHVNFPGGIPVDGPSAGVAVATAIYSAIKGIPVDNFLAITGEISIRGLLAPVGGILTKLEAARRAGAKQVILPKENYQDMRLKLPGLTITPLEKLEDVLKIALVNAAEPTPCPKAHSTVRKAKSPQPVIPLPGSGAIGANN